MKKKDFIAEIESIIEECFIPSDGDIIKTFYSINAIRNFYRKHGGCDIDMISSLNVDCAEKYLEILHRYLEII